MNNTNLVNSSEFDLFYKEMYGYKPHMWQSKLAKRVCADGWPSNITLPTGFGKTSVIDIGVFHLATQATLGYNRTAHTRIVYVVDRRLIVDNAYAHAINIANALRNPQNSPTVRKVAQALKSLRPRGWSSSSPLDVMKMRGGLGTKMRHLNSPTSPTIIISTVDQAGSRLLFRGYGVSRTSRPIYAGRFSADCLYVLDEAHLSRPFVGTVRQIYRMQLDKLKESRPITAVSLGATVDTAQEESIFPDVERKSMLEDLGSVFTVKKPAQMITVKHNDIPTKLAEWALEYILKKPSTKNTTITDVAVIVNRVGEARRVFDQIKRKLGSKTDVDVHLLIGLSRPIDRRHVEKEIHKIKNKDAGKKAVFVATQCIEAGVDVSFDAIITRVAPIDSLRQRFGRVNRDGTGPITTAKIVATEVDLDDKQVDHVYGTATAKTWEYLESIAVDDVVDFGSKSLDYLTTDPPRCLNDMLAPSPPELEISPAYVRLWNHTYPSPEPDPDPAAFLHGPENRSADVFVVWRSELNTSSNSREPPLLVPPASGETISMPIWTVKSWLSNKEMQDVSDVEGAKEPNEPQVKETSVPPVIIKRGYGRHAKYNRADPTYIKPGDTVIVPANYGGCDKYGWMGTSIKDYSNTNEVEDLSVEASLEKNRLPIKLDKKYILQLCGKSDQGRNFDDVWNDIDSITQGEHAEPKTFIGELLEIDGLPTTLRHILQIIEQSRGNVYIQHETRPDGSSMVVGIGCDSIGFQDLEKIKQDLGIESDARIETNQGHQAKSNIRQQEIKLDDHCAAVESVVMEFGRNVVPERILHDIACAAFLHDIGKRDPKFQACLRGVAPNSLLESWKPLAKSNDDQLGRERKKRRDIAKLPRGYRHEMMSVIMARNDPRLKSTHDQDLVLYLIGTHHGYGRALFPPSSGTHTELYGQNHDILSQWFQIVEKTYKKYGPFQLACMEGILRLADWAQSGYEKQGIKEKW